MTAHTAHTIDNGYEFSVPELADQWRVSQRVIRKWIAEGKFPNAYKLSLGRNSDWRIPKADVLAFDQQRRSN